MKNLIRFYLLEGPHNTSDMIRDLTTKELSRNSEERRKQIPRIAGNWFRKNEGYIWELKDEDKVIDSGRRYNINKEGLIDEIINGMKIQECFPEYDVKGENAKLSNAYTKLLSEFTLKDLKEELERKVFTGSKMNRLFDFEKWKDYLLEKTENSKTIFKYQLRFDFMSIIHLILISSILKSRKSRIKEKIEQGESYFSWKNRLDKLRENEDSLRKKILENSFPWIDLNSNGEPTNKELKAVYDSFKEKSVELDEEATKTLTKLYLLYFKDGVELFDQYSKYDHSKNLFFNLLERGWMVDSQTVERDSRTGNLIVPLKDVRSYLDDLSNLFHKNHTG